MQEEVDNRDGAVQQLQMKLDDAIAQGAGPGAPGREAGGDGGDGDEPDVVVSNTTPPSPEAAAGSSWATRAPTAQLRLRGVATMSSAVGDMLNSLGSLDVMEIAAPGDDPTETHIPLTERLEILIDAIMKVSSKGVVGEVSAPRFSALQAGLREGYTELRRHSNECRSQMRVRANYSNMACLVNKDLNEWAGQLYTQSSIFTGQHLVPPRTSEFPALIVPMWTWLTHFIRAGGLHNSQHQPPPRASAPRGGGWQSGNTTPSVKVGCCYAWATAGGCSPDERDCKFEQAHDPAKENKLGGGNRNGNRSRGYNNRAGSNADGGSGGGGGGSGSSSGGRGGGGGGGRSGGGSN
eukprot:g15070.t1